MDVVLPTFCHVMLLVAAVIYSRPVFIAVENKRLYCKTKNVLKEWIAMWPSNAAGYSLTGWQNKGDNGVIQSFTLGFTKNKETDYRVDYIE